MSLSIIYSRASNGIEAPVVTVETHISAGMAGLYIVGLAEAAVKESKDRVRSALLNSRFEFPARRITINLAPADLPKEGGRFDLPIALGILAASQQIPLDVLSEYEFAGELALSGELRPFRGVLPVALGAHLVGRKLIVPHQNANEAAIIEEENVLAASHLLEVCAHLRGETKLNFAKKIMITNTQHSLDLSDVKGQAHAKRALEIAAVGKHSLLFVGPPGTGKTMLASRITTILPELSNEAALEVAAIASVSSSGFHTSNWKQIPFRSPHHTSSGVALIGGGRPPKPGEISLAHLGILFLDELPEFNRHVLECLREPLECGCVTISRAAYQTIFPARFQLIAAMNPCPCGYAGSKVDECQCSTEQIRRYINKLSGPFLDRIDMQVEVAKLSSEVLIQTENIKQEKSATVLERVKAAKQFQKMRQEKSCNAINADSELNAINADSELNAITSDAIQLLQQAMIKFNFSARAYHRILKVARTIADLENEMLIEARHVSEALSYRILNRLKTKIS